MHLGGQGRVTRASRQRAGRVLTFYSQGKKIGKSSVMATGNDFMTTVEASQALGYTVQHTRLLVRQGHLRGAKIGRDWMIIRESVAEYGMHMRTAPLIPTSKRGRPRVQRRVQP